jgi:hypothetical protein
MEIRDYFKPVECRKRRVRKTGGKASEENAKKVSAKLIAEEKEHPARMAGLLDGIL